MDPNANLAELTQLSHKVLKDLDNLAAVDLDEVERTCELFIALNEWLTKGGFLPTDWNKVCKR